MAYLAQIDTSTLSNQNISSALLAHTFTNTTRVRKIFVGVDLAQIAGNGDYSAYVTIQRAGAGNAYPSVLTTEAVPSGVTLHTFHSIALVLNATDVLKVYVVGLAGDTTTPDIATYVWEEFVNVDSSGNPTPNDSSGISTLLARVTAAVALNSDMATLLARIVGTLAAGTHNPQTGDAYARIGANGAGLTALGDTRIANLDGAISGIPTAPTANENADALLKRDWTSVTGEASRSVLNALRFLRNKWSLSGTTLSVKEEDDTTEAWSATVTTQAGAEPITGTDPS